MLAAGSTEEVAHSASSMWESTLDALPRVGIALAVVALAWLAGRLVRTGLVKGLRRRHTPSFATVMAKLGGWAVTSVGVFLALAVTFPSVQPVDLLAGLGFFSVAIGFAFQDILENLLAGILLLFRQPFVAGDEICVEEHEGIVERITIRETVLVTFDGEVTLIPNADVYKNVVRIQTAHRQRRNNFVVGVAYETDLERARAVAVEAVNRVQGVKAQPAPEALLVSLSRSTIDLDIRYWSAPREHDSRLVLDRAIAAVKCAFDAEGIEMPSDIVALRATASFAAGLRGGAVTPGGVVGSRDGTSNATRRD